MDTSQEFVVRPCENGGLLVERIKPSNMGMIPDRVGAFTTAADMIAWLADQYGLQSHPTPKVVVSPTLDGPLSHEQVLAGWRPIPNGGDIPQWPVNAIVQIDYGQGRITTVLATLADWKNAVAFRLYEPPETSKRDRAVSEEQGRDDWIKWEGGQCPVETDRAVKIRFRDGVELVLASSRSVRWDHNARLPLPRDVVAYRLV